MQRFNPALLGVGMMALGMFLFAANDALGKWLVESHSVGQVLLIRSAAALVVLAPFLWAFGPRRLVRLDRPGLQAARVVFSTAEVFCFYWAVRHMPLADTMTFWLAVPIHVALMSPLLLGERVSPWRWGAILLGFAGVVIALGPAGEGQPMAVAVAVLGSLCFALMIVTGRSLRGTPDMALVFWQLVGAGVAGLIVAPMGWSTPTPLDWSLLALVGVVAMGAHLCVNRALKLADAGLLAPLQYTLLPWAVLLGWLVFADVPRPAMLLGAGIIVVAGLMLVLPERRARGRPDGVSE